MNEPILPEDYIYSEEEIEELKLRSLTDPLCRKALNNYNLLNNNPSGRMYNALVVAMETTLISQIKDGTLKIDAKSPSFASSIISLMESSPRMAKGLQDWKKAAEGKQLESPDEIKKMSTADLIRQHGTSE